MVKVVTVTVVWSIYEPLEFSMKDRTLGIDGRWPTALLLLRILWVDAAPLRCVLRNGLCTAGLLYCLRDHTTLRATAR